MAGDEKMKDVYLDKIVDITDPNCQFIMDMNSEISQYGAIVYNYENNSYQYIRKFSDIDHKKELLPDFIKVEKSDGLLNGLNLTIHYEFDPENEEDKENLEIWNNELSLIEYPIYAYDEEGQIYDDKYIKLNNKPTKHTIWFLKPETLDYLYGLDLLMFTPVIKDMTIIRKLIKEYTFNPINETTEKKKKHKVEVCDGCEE